MCHAIPAFGKAFCLRRVVHIAVNLASTNSSHLCMQGISYWVRYPDKFPGAHVSVLYEAKQNHSVRMRDDSSMNLGELDPAEETNSPSAILFLHGVGLGLVSSVVYEIDCE